MPLRTGQTYKAVFTTPGEPRAYVQSVEDRIVVPGGLALRKSGSNEIIATVTSAQATTFKTAITALDSDEGFRGLPIHVTIGTQRFSLWTTAITFNTANTQIIFDLELRIDLPFENSPTTAEVYVITSPNRIDSDNDTQAELPTTDRPVTRGTALTDNVNIRVLDERVELEGSVYPIEFNTVNRITNISRFNVTAGTDMLEFGVVRANVISTQDGSTRWSAFIADDNYIRNAESGAPAAQAIAPPTGNPIIGVSQSNGVWTFPRADGTVLTITVAQADLAKFINSAQLVGSAIVFTSQDGTITTIQIPESESDDDFVDLTIAGNVITATTRAGDTKTITIPIRTNAEINSLADARIRSAGNAATDAQFGTVVRASQAEATAGVEGTKYITSQTLRTTVDARITATTRTFAQISAGLNALTGSDRVNYNSLINTPTIPTVTAASRAQVTALAATNVFVTPDSLNGLGSVFWPRGIQIPRGSLDLSGTQPLLPEGTDGQVLTWEGSSWTAADPTATTQRTFAQISAGLNALSGNERLDYTKFRNTPTLSTVATSGDYNDLSNRPTIPTQRTFAQISAGLNALTGNQRVDYLQLRNRPAYDLPAGTADNQVLTWDAATNTWVAEAPTSGSSKAPSFIRAGWYGGGRVNVPAANNIQFSTPIGVERTGIGGGAKTEIANGAPLGTGVTFSAANGYRAENGRGFSLEFDDSDDDLIDFTTIAFQIDVEKHAEFTNDVVSAYFGADVAPPGRTTIPTAATAGMLVSFVWGRFLQIQRMDTRQWLTSDGRWVSANFTAAVDLGEDDALRGEFALEIGYSKGLLVVRVSGVAEDIYNQRLPSAPDLDGNLFGILADYETSTGATGEYIGIQGFVIHDLTPEIIDPHAHEETVTEAQVDARITANVQSWALDTTTPIPANKLGNIAGLSQVQVDARVRSADNAADLNNRGNVQLASDSDTAAGADFNKAITPRSMRIAIGTAGLMRDAIDARVVAVGGGGGGGLDAAQVDARIVSWARASSTAIIPTNRLPTILTSAQVDARVRNQVNRATTALRGNIELATTAEVTAGADGEKAVTPSTLRLAIATNGNLRTAIQQAGGGTTPPNATTGARGIIEIATNAEASAGTRTDLAVTPAGLNAWGNRTIAFTQNGSTVNRSFDQVLVAAVNRAIADGDLTL